MKILVVLVALAGYVVPIKLEFDTLVPHSGGIGGIFRGSDAKTYVKGPDGSVISSEQTGAIESETVGPNIIETRVAEGAKTEQTRRKTSGTVEFRNQGLNLNPPFGQYLGSPLPLGHSTIIVETSKPLYGGRARILEDQQIVNFHNVRDLPLLLNARVDSFPIAADNQQQLLNTRTLESVVGLPSSAILQTPGQRFSMEATLNEQVPVSTGGDLPSTVSISDNSLNYALNRRTESSRLSNKSDNLTYQNEIIGSSEFPLNTQQIDQKRRSKSYVSSQRYQIIESHLGDHIADPNLNVNGAVPQSTVTVSSPSTVQLTSNSTASSVSETYQQQITDQLLQSSGGSRLSANTPSGPLFSPFTPTKSAVNGRQFSVQESSFSEYQNTGVLENNRAAIQNAATQDRNYDELRNTANENRNLEEIQVPTTIQASGGSGREQFLIPPVATATPLRPQLNFQQLFLDPSAIPPRNIVPPEIHLLPPPPPPPTGSIFLRSNGNFKTNKAMYPQRIEASAASRAQVSNLNRADSTELSRTGASAVSRSELAVSTSDGARSTITKVSPSPRVEVAQVSAIPRDGLFPVPRAHVFPHPRAEGFVTPTRMSKVTSRTNLALNSSILVNEEANNINQNKNRNTIRTYAPLPQTGVPIGSQGVLNSQLRRQGIDPSKIIFSQIPLSDVTVLDSSATVNTEETSLNLNTGEYEDTSVVLANRYGRKARKD